MDYDAGEYATRGGHGDEGDEEDSGAQGGGAFGGLEVEGEVVFAWDGLVLGSGLGEVALAWDKGKSVEEGGEEGGDVGGFGEEGERNEWVFGPALFSVDEQ